LGTFATESREHSLRESAEPEEEEEDQLKLKTKTTRRNSAAELSSGQRDWDSLFFQSGQSARIRSCD
jgi:hypothetical protein